MHHLSDRITHITALLHQSIIGTRQSQKDVLDKCDIVSVIYQVFNAHCHWAQTHLMVKQRIKKILLENIYI